MGRSLYTKYRPQQFKDVIGQDISVKILKNSLKDEAVNHAYLFYGIRGTGKTTLARIFAKLVNCTNSNDYEPCDSCASCKAISTSSSFDVIEIDAASNSGVDEIRDIKEKASFSTTNSKYKIYIIDEIHMLSKNAFNALLKLIEEPPKNVIFLFATTEINKIPETILSRSIILNLSLINDKDIKDNLNRILEGENVPRETLALDYIVQLSGGSARDSISLLEKVLLYDINEVTVEGVTKSLGIVDIDYLKQQFTELNIVALYEIINSKEKDISKILTLIIKTLSDIVFIDKDARFNKLLRQIINESIFINDPEILRASLKLIFQENIKTTNNKEVFNIQKIVIDEKPVEKISDDEEKKMDLKTSIKPKLLNETLVKEGNLEPNKEEINNEPFPTHLSDEQSFINNDKNANTETKKDEQFVKEDKENKTTPTFTSSTEIVITNKEELNKSVTETKTEKLNVPRETLVETKEQNKTPLKIDIKSPLYEEDIVKVDKKTKTITQKVTTKTYLNILSHHDKELFNSIKQNWCLIPTLFNNHLYKKYISALSNTKPLSAASNIVIVGFEDKEDLEDFKTFSLEKDLTMLMKEVVGKELYILPTSSDNWSKLVALHNKRRNTQRIKEGEEAVLLNATLEERVVIEDQKVIDIKDTFGSLLEVEDE